ncbi:MAG: argininosuccinate lyase [Candidatus Micrarchaeota archaeon]|nr:argininosuccinate lyase [Candidatus Micrarchaeota archaeon]
MKLWDKGYGIDKEVNEFSTGEDYLLDRKLVRYDCLASIAHAKMLGRIGILKPREVKKLDGALRKIIRLDAKGRFTIRKEDEDCHTAIENYLIRELGQAGKKIHTARSRNDQVAVALRLYYRDELSACERLAMGFIAALKDFRSKYGDIKMPGYTHTRKAMPSSMGMWSESFAESMGDNIKLLQAAYKLVDQSPLGTGAGYGVPLKIDRALTARELGFARIQRNPIYVQNSRGKFESVIVGALSVLMFDLNKIAEDLIMFSMPEFGYFVIPRELTGGSSMMPHKKNPDVLEILRANYHLMNSYEFRIKGVIANLPSGYNRDLQLTKGPVMRSFETAENSLRVATKIMKRIKADKRRSEEGLSEEVYATERAYSLVKRGTPFRDAYKRAARRNL